MHLWKYRNPADRTCRMCGHRENLYMQVYETDNGEEYIASQWWEVVYPLSTTECPGIIAWALQQMTGKKGE